MQNASVTSVLETEGQRRGSTSVDPSESERRRLVFHWQLAHFLIPHCMLCQTLLTPHPILDGDHFLHLAEGETEHSCLWSPLS